MSMVVGALYRVVRRYCRMLRIFVVFRLRQPKTKRMCSAVSFSNLDCFKGISQRHGLRQLAIVVCKGGADKNLDHFLNQPKTLPIFNRAHSA